MPKKMKLIDLTKIKKSHYLFMHENAKIITEAKACLENYQSIINEIGYTPEIKQKLQDKLISEGKQNEITEALSQEKNNIEKAIYTDIKKYKKLLQLQNNLLNPKL